MVRRKVSRALRRVHFTLEASCFCVRVSEASFEHVLCVASGAGYTGCVARCSYAALLRHAASSHMLKWTPIPWGPKTLRKFWTVPTGDSQDVLWHCMGSFRVWMGTSHGSLWVWVGAFPHRHCPLTHRA